MSNRQKKEITDNYSSLNEYSSLITRNRNFSRFSNLPQQHPSPDYIKNFPYPTENDTDNTLAENDDTYNLDNSNLYLSNLSVHLTEESLYKHFIKFGGIESIKIMPPKTEGIFNKNIAFVKFLCPKYAKTAKEMMNDKIISGNLIRIKWGKKFSSFSSNSIPDHILNILPQIYVKIPQNKRLRTLIDKIAKLIVEEGYLCEKYIIEKEKDNPDFNFILFQGTEENTYYRWRVYSYAQGDTDSYWREELFQFNIGGNIWHPPAREVEINKNGEKQIAAEKSKIKENIETETEDKSSSDSEDEYKVNETSLIGHKTLNEKIQSELKNLLDHLSTKRYSIKKTMKFCYDNIQSAKGIIELIHQSIANSKKLQEKIAKLYLLSDILYNSCNVNIFNSWCFKKEIESVLPEIFEEMNTSYIDSIGRITHESFKATVLSLLKLWKKWNVFELIYIEGLEATFLKDKSIREKAETKSELLIMSQLETYEDELLDLFTKNSESLKYLASSNGVSCKGEISEIISKLVCLKEFKLKRELIKNEKIQQEKEMEKKLIENLHEMDKKIKQFKSALNSLQTSYKIINDFDVDGFPIDDIELEFLNLKEEVRENVLNNATQSAIVDNVFTYYDEDLDGEPL